MREPLCLQMRGYFNAFLKHIFVFLKEKRNIWWQTFICYKLDFGF